MMTTRRGIITGLVSFMAAPAIVRAASLMPVKAVVLSPYDRLAALGWEQVHINWKFAAYAGELLRVQR